MTDLIKEKLKVLLEGLQIHPDKFKLYESQPIKNLQQRTQKLMQLQKLIKGKTVMIEAENNQLSQMIPGLKGERPEEETKANKIWN